MTNLPALDRNQENYIFIESEMASLGIFKQWATSNTLFTLDYSEILVEHPTDNPPVSETIQSLTFSFAPVSTPSLLVSGNTIVDIGGVSGKGASFLLGGGVDGVVYTVMVIATTSLGQVRVDTLDLAVTSESNAVGWPIFPPE